MRKRESAAQQVLKRTHDQFGSLLQFCSLLLAFLLLTFSGAWVCLWPWLCREPSALVSLFLTFARCSRCPLSINTVSAELEECSECVCMTVYASVCVCVIVPMCSVEVFVDFTYAIYEKLCRISLPLLFPFLLPFLLQFLILLAQLCLRSVTVSANSGKAAAQVTQLVSHTHHTHTH